MKEMIMIMCINNVCVSNNSNNINIINNDNV